MMLYLRKKTIIVIVLSSMTVAGLLSFFLEPIYEAKSVFFVSASPDTLLYMSSPNAEEIKRKPLLPLPNENQQDVYLGILRSKSLQEAVSKKMNMRYHDLQSGTDFRVTSEYFMEIYVRDKDPERAAAIANIYPEMFNSFLDSISSGPMVKNRLSIENEIKDVRQKLNKAENDLKDFKLANNLILINEDASAVNQEKVKMQMDIERAQIAFKITKDNISKLEELLEKEGRVYVSSPLIYSNPTIMKLQTMLSDMESRMATLKLDVREAHPDFIKIKTEYDEKKKELEQEIKKTVESEAKWPDSFHEKLRQQMINNLVESQSTLAKIAGLRNAVANLNKRMESFPALQEEMESLNRNAALYKGTLNTLRLHLEEINAQEKHKMQNVIVVSPATVPETPAFPVNYLNIPIAGLLGFIISVFYCFFIGYIERVKNPERVW